MSKKTQSEENLKNKSNISQKQAAKRKQKEIDDASGYISDMRSPQQNSPASEIKEVKNNNEPKRAKKKKLTKTENKEKTANENIEIKLRDANNYLNLFVSDRASWKFKKVTQNYIFRNLYSAKFDEIEFEKILLYLIDCKGQAREAKKIHESDEAEISKIPENVLEVGSEEKPETPERAASKKERAIRILSALS